MANAFTVLLRGSALAGGLLIVGGLAGLWLQPTLRAAWSLLGSGQGVSPDRSLVAGITVVVAAVLTVVWLWALVTVVACTAEAARAGGPWGTGPGIDSTGRSPLLRPRVARLLVTVAIGSAVTPLPAGATTAVTGGIDRGPGRGQLSAGLCGLTVPDRVTDARTRLPASPARHTVRDGDSLWSIAERLLPGRTSPAAVDQRWRELYRINRHGVGADPDLIHAGDRLRLPPPRHPHPTTGEIR